MLLINKTTEDSAIKQFNSFQTGSASLRRFLMTVQLLNQRKKNYKFLIIPKYKSFKKQETEKFNLNRAKNMKNNSKTKVF